MPKKKAHSNCLHGMRCPRCNSLEPFAIGITTTVRFYDEGSDDQLGDDEWGDDSSLRVLQMRVCRDRRRFHHSSSIWSRSMMTSPHLCEVTHFHLFCGPGGGAQGFNKGQARVGIAIIRAFVHLREMIAANKDLAARVGKLELSQRQTSSIIEVLVEEIDTMRQLPDPPGRKIGFDL